MTTSTNPQDGDAAAAAGGGGRLQWRQQRCLMVACVIVFVAKIAIVVHTEEDQPHQGWRTTLLFTLVLLCPTLILETDRLPRPVQRPPPVVVFITTAAMSFLPQFHVPNLPKVHLLEAAAKPDLAFLLVFIPIVIICIVLVPPSHPAAIVQRCIVMIVGIIVIIGNGGIVPKADAAPRPLPLLPPLSCSHPPPPVGNCPTAYLADCYIYSFVAPLLVKLPPTAVPPHQW
jgi:hypothetical protein